MIVGIGIRVGLTWCVESSRNETCYSLLPGSRPSDLIGTYTGIWQSTVYAASGAAVMTVSTQGKVVGAEMP
jgi:hypothetical protein